MSFSVPDLTIIVFLFFDNVLNIFALFVFIFIDLLSSPLIPNIVIFVFNFRVNRRADLD